MRNVDQPQFYHKQLVCSNMFQLNMLGLSSDDLISMTLNDIYQPTNPESDELPKELRWPILVATDGFTGAQAEVGGARPGPCEGQH